MRYDPAAVRGKSLASQNDSLRDSILDSCKVLRDFLADCPGSAVCPRLVIASWVISVCGAGGLRCTLTAAI